MANQKVATANDFNPIFIGKGWSVWRGPANGEGLSGDEDRDPRSLDLTSVDFGKVQFLSCLREGEISITGEEKLKRLKDGGHIRLGNKVFYALWLDWKANGESSVLEWLRRNLKITYLDFFEVLRSPRGYRYVPYLDWHGGRWNWDYNWLDNDWNDKHVSAVLPATLFISLLDFYRESFVL